MTAKQAATGAALWLKVALIVLCGGAVVLFLAGGIVGLAVIGWRALF